MRFSRVFALVAALATLTLTPSLSANPRWTEQLLLDHLVRNTGALYEQIRLFVREQHHAIYQTQVIPYEIERAGWIRFDAHGRVIPSRTAYLGKPFFDGVWRNHVNAPVALQPRHPEYIKQETVRRFYDLHEASKYLANLFNGRMIHAPAPFGPVNPRDVRVHTGAVIAQIINSMGLPSPDAGTLSRQNAANWNLAWFVTDASYQNTYAILSILHAAVYDVLKVRNHPLQYRGPHTDFWNYVLGYRLQAIAHYHANVRYLMDQILHFRALNVGHWGNCYAGQFPVFSFHFNHHARPAYTGGIRVYPVFPLVPGAAIPRFNNWGHGGPHAAHFEYEYNVERWQVAAPGVTIPDPYGRGYVAPQVERAPGAPATVPWQRPLSPAPREGGPVVGPRTADDLNGPVPDAWRSFQPTDPGTLTPPSDPADVGPAPRPGEIELPPGSDPVDPEPLPPIPAPSDRPSVTSPTTPAPTGPAPTGPTYPSGPTYPAPSYPSGPTYPPSSGYPGGPGGYRGPYPGGTYPPGSVPGRRAPGR